MPSLTEQESGRILAAIDASGFSASVCDHAVWAAGRLGAPLEFLHILDRHLETAPVIDLSGNLDLGAHENLLRELASLDERRSKFAQERGSLLVESAKRRAEQAGVPGASGRMQNGAVVETLSGLEREVRLFVLGKQGRHEGAAKGHLGGNLERVVRAVHRPLLVTPKTFETPERVLIGFDGSPTTRKAVEMVAASPLFRNLSCHLLLAGAETTESRAQLSWAASRLKEGGFDASVIQLPGHADHVIPEYVRAESINLLVMGAYGHSRVRNLVVGSTTATLLRTCDIPMLLTR